MEELIKIQSELKVPKNQENKFAHYHFRSAEDIQEAIKPLLLKYQCHLTISYDIVMIGERYYYKATAIIVNSKQESIAIQTRTSVKSQMVIPASSRAGRYRLKTTAYYDSKTADAFFMFDVKGDSEVIDQCPASCDDSNVCTEDYCNENYKCAHDVLVPCCGNNKCETGETSDSCSADCAAPVDVIPDGDQEYNLAEINQIAQDMAFKNPSSAKEFCDGLAKEIHRDSCYTEVAKTSKNSNYCEYVVSDSRRDNCYTDFALNGDYSVCEKIMNKWLKDSCLALAQIG